MRTFASSFAPRTPAAGPKSLEKGNKDVSTLKTFNPTPQKIVGKENPQNFQACPCCRQRLPSTLKVVRVAEVKEDSSPSVQSSKRKGRKRKSKEQVNIILEVM